MTQFQRRPYWIDQLHEKHECWDYDNPLVMEVQYKECGFKILMPAYLPDVVVSSLAVVDNILFLLGEQINVPDNLDEKGVVIIAKHIRGDIWTVVVWHELFSEALKYLGFASEGTSEGSLE